MKIKILNIVCCITVFLLLSTTVTFAKKEISLLNALDNNFQATIRDAKNKVFPAVVFIMAILENHREGEKVSISSSGSGVIISEKGEVLTNWHVVDKAVEIRCLLFDGRSYNAKMIGGDKDTDIALLSLEYDTSTTNKPFPVALIGDSEVLTEGDFVMAMGAPWGLSRSISIGIVSCKNRYLVDSSEYSLWIQTDAAISPGNSGGPLVSTDGKIIGINARGIMAGGDMGFAVPSETIKKMLPRIRKYGKINWSWTGLNLQPIKDFHHNIYFDEENGGVIIAGTDPESPARRAGILIKDRLLSINGKKVEALTEEALPLIRQRLGLLPMKMPAKLEILRGESEIILEIIPREKGTVEGDELDCPRWDFSIKTINKFDNPNLYFYRKTGIFVYGIKSIGNAISSGLKKNDIIVSIDGKKVTTIDEIRELNETSIKNIKNKSKILISVLRNGLMRQIVLDYARNWEK